MALLGLVLAFLHSATPAARPESSQGSHWSGNLPKLMLSFQGWPAPSRAAEPGQQPPGPCPAQ